GDNPADWHGLHQYRFPTLPATDKQHFSAMHYDSIPEFIRRLRTHQNRSTTAVALEFTILCASRSSETLRMKWSEINFEQRVCTIPEHRMKAGREHRVPLSARAIVLLEKQREHAVGDPYLSTLGFRVEIRQHRLPTGFVFYSIEHRNPSRGRKR